MQGGWWLDGAVLELPPIGPAASKFLAKQRIDGGGPSPEREKVRGGPGLVVAGLRRRGQVERPLKKVFQPRCI